MSSAGRSGRAPDLPLVDLPDPDDERIYEPARAFLAQYRPFGYAIGCFINLGSDPVVLSMGWDNFSYALYDDPLCAGDAHGSLHRLVCAGGQAHLPARL